MTQDQFENLLAWTMLGTLNSHDLLKQKALGRELTEEEHKSCFREAQDAAELIRAMLAGNRKATKRSL